MKQQHCYLIKPGKTVMANQKTTKKWHQQFRNRRRVCYRLIFKRKSQNVRGRQTGGKVGRSHPKTELLQTHLLSLQPGVSHNHSHSAVLEYVPWKFRQVSYLWKIATALSPTTIETKLQHTHTHTPSQT